MTQEKSDSEFFAALKNEINSKRSVRNGINPSVVSDDSQSSDESDGLDQFVVENKQEIWAPQLPEQLPEPKVDIVAGPISLSEQQKNNISILAYSLATRNMAIEPEPIYHLWPVEGDPFKLRRAGKRPSITGIQQFLATEDFAKRMGERGIDIAPQQGLSPEQIALIHILTDASSKLSFNARLKKAGISSAKYNGWRRQKPFADALSQGQSGVLHEVIGNVDVQLASMAQNGDLNSIKYLNEMVGRGPNNRKAVDAIQFARIVLEAVQKNVNPDQARAISAEIELASKQLGIGA